MLGRLVTTFFTPMEGHPLSSFSFVVGFRGKEEFEDWVSEGEFVPPLTDFLPVAEDFWEDVLFVLREEGEMKGFLGIFYPTLVAAPQIGRTYRGRYYLFFQSPFFFYFGGLGARREVFNLVPVYSFSLETFPTEGRVGVVLVAAAPEVPLPSLLTDLHLLLERGWNYTERDFLTALARRVFG